MPVEWALGQGPRYTILGDGRIIFEGPTIEIYPQPLLPNTLLAQLSSEHLREILRLVDEMGLPGIESEHDGTAESYVADATTEVVTYWDENGTHTYSVYALGIDPDPADERAAGFLALIEAIDRAASSVDDAAPYEGESVRLISGVAQAPVDPEFEDVRPWPLQNTDFEEWTELENGWLCAVEGPDVLSTFEDATQATEWLHPNPMMDAPTYRILVRPLHPGENDCPS